MARRWIFYLVINVLVSAATILVVLYLWDRSKQPAPVSVATLATPLEDPGTRTPSPQPTVTPYMYLVKPGDTLGSIAQDFGVDLDELAAYNNIVDVDVLDPGMRLIIPPGSRVVSAASRFPTVTPQQKEAFPWPVIEAVLSPGDLEHEEAHIKNSGPPAILTGWKIRTAKGVEYNFKDFSLVTQGAVFVHTGEGVDTSIDLYWGSTEPVWNSGDEAFLLDSQGNLRSVFLIP
jgi:LysM repeat protein